MGHHKEVRLAGITFDLDGTLGETLPVCYAAFRQAFLVHTGKNFTDEEIHALFGPCEKGAIARVLPVWEPAYDTFLTAYEDAHDLCQAPFPGMIDLLDSLGRRGIRMAVVTGKGPESAAISLRRLGLADRFEVVEAGSPEGPVKKEAIWRMLDRWQFPPSTVAHVGDAPSDIRSAREAGVTAIAAAWSVAARLEALHAENPDAIFTSVISFGQWLAAT